jgi:hypothetical protein
MKYKNKIAVNNKRVLFVILLHSGIAIAQFSPGDLSKAHKHLEGSQNCTQCHELGKEIRGAKCLGCHEEIKMLIDTKRGLHATNTSAQCVKCHREHLGREAKTVLFDEKNFDHARTGFVLTGKHSIIQCEKCHTEKNIKEATVKRKLSGFPHKSFLGLDTVCVACHEDPHRGQLNQNCSSCHNTVAWSQVKNFDHSKAKFPLEGKHISVSCTKCHQSFLKGKPNQPVDFKTFSFSDCTPCHTTPHVSKFNGKACSSCHNVQGWSIAIEKPFDHNLTRYKLIGGHSSLRCDQCHRITESRNFSQAYLLLHSKCIDCHTDKHSGEFLRNYSNNCSSCHTEYGYKPSTFTIERHNQNRFKLTGAHVATICSGCHRKSENNTSVFHFDSIRCESCHKDLHGGKFNTLMKDLSCAKCHTTEQWKTSSFDHSKTKFVLVGKHAVINCSDCHKEINIEKKVMEFRKLSTDCQSCHNDIHRDQFAVTGKTNCNTCHNSYGWKSLVFNHETQSVFSLKGAHKNVACRACHHEEKINDTIFIRLKPLSVKCESCHGQRNIK